MCSEPSLRKWCSHIWMKKTAWSDWCTTLEVKTSLHQVVATLISTCFKKNQVCYASLRKFWKWLFCSQFQDRIPNKWRGVWKNPERFLSSMSSITKTSHKCHSLRDSNESLQCTFPYFSISYFLVLVIIFGHGSREYGEEFSKTGRHFSQAWVHLQKPLPIL